MGINKTSGAFSLQDEDSGEKAKVSLKADGVTQALHTIAETTILSDPSTPIYTSYDPRAIDAIGRFRVSNPKTLFELSAGEGLDQVRYVTTATLGGGTVVYDDASASGKYTVSSSGDKVTVQTRRHIEYSQGTSQFILMAGRFATPTANLLQRRGYFYDENGLFLEVDGTTYNFVVRSDLSGSVVDTKIPQSSWNYDKLDGTGASGKTWNPTKQAGHAIDFVWNSGIVRWYIEVDGQYHLCHVSSFSNLEVPFMRSGMAPLRSQIEATGAIGGSFSMYTTSGVVATEGNLIQSGRIRVVDTGTNTVSVNTNEKVVAGIKLKADKTNAAIKAIGFEITPNSGSGLLYYKVVYNPTITGTWVDLEGLAQGLTNNPSYTGGSVVDSGFISLGTGSKNKAIGASLDVDVESDIYLGSDVDGNPDALILTVERLSSSGSASIAFSGQYREFF